MLPTKSTAVLDGRVWKLSLLPQHSALFKRIFDGVEKHGQNLVLSDTPRHARDLLWFAERHPIEFDPLFHLLGQADVQIQREHAVERILSSEYVPSNPRLAVTLRDYQSRAGDLCYANGGLLLGDDVGLGKTFSAVGLFARRDALPAVVVTLTALPNQWVREINRAAPDLRAHAVKSPQPYPLDMANGKRVPIPDVLVMSYSKLTSRKGRTWVEKLTEEGLVKTVVFDEGQELRNNDSDRYRAARTLREAATYCMLTTATPVFNHGAEIHNVVEIVQPGALGSRTEFLREWCGRSDSEESMQTRGTGEMRKIRVKDPIALGAHLREIGVMLRRTRAEVGRELPALQRVMHTVDVDQNVFAETETAIEKLCRALLYSSDRTERFKAAGDLDWQMRRATGMAKVIHGAHFVRMLVESGEKVLLYAWHHECFGRGTKILMHDGHTKDVEDVLVGDLVMGPDSKPRTVKNLVRGNGPMYKVVPTKGDPWVCSQNHLLSLKYAGGTRYRPLRTITASEFAATPKRTQEALKLYRAAAISFPNETPVQEPWLFGYWLGDGASSLRNGVVLSSADPEVATELSVIADRWGLTITRQPCHGGKSPCNFYRFSNGRLGPHRNPMTSLFRGLGVHKNKHIPSMYKTASLDARRELLAGLLDSDGHVHTGNGVGSATITSKFRTLADDIAFVCRSLGLAAYVRPVHLKTSKTTNVRPYFIVNISGDLTSIPTKIARKKALPRTNRKNVLHVGLRLEEVGVDDYFGFEVDGDHLFLLSDFTVVHNCYDELRRIFTDPNLGDLKPAFFTGKESISAKERARERFVGGETDLLVMSLRAGAGIDGLQHVCKTVVFLELDWSPAVHEQAEGRIFRDGQKHPVMAYYLVTDEGSDPVVRDALNLKTEQQEGIRNLTGEIARLQGSEEHMRKVALAYLKRKGKLH